MFDISWGEIAVLVGVGFAVTGRKDLPAAFRFAGSHLGRIVGLMQGARARADQFATNHELRQLQNELRSGLRELDQVKTELAVAASSRGMIGRGLGATVPSANRVGPTEQTIGSISSTTTTTSATPGLGFSHLNTSSPPTRIRQPAPTDLTTFHEMPYTPSQNLAPLAQTMRASAEEEWEKQGIGFKSRAEQGIWLGAADRNRGVGARGGMAGKTGSEILEHIIKQNLIFDQYDRVVGEQEAAVQQRVDAIREKHATKNDVAAEQKFESSRKDRRR
jgi:Sec-independent protein translocase protein TatA